MVMSRCACTASLLVQALSASTSNDRNIAELYGLGQGYSGAGSAVLAGVSGMLWSALLSSIEGRLFECVVGQFPLGKQRTISAVRDQRVDCLQHGLLQRLFLDRQSDAGELLRDGLAHSRIGAGLKVHDVGQRLVALCRGIDAALPELGAGVGRSVGPDELNRIGAAILLAPGRDLRREHGAAAGADLLATERGCVLELRLARLLHEELRAAAQIIDEGCYLVPAGIVREARQDGIHPARRNRRHELGKAGLGPFDLDAKLAPEC